VGEDLFAPGEDAPAAKGKRPRRKADGAKGAISVSALIARVKGVLADVMPAKIAVVGEISNLKMHSSGHVYFRLKDATSAIDAAMFRSAAAKLKFTPTDGMEVVVEGRVDVYDVRGQLQLYVHRMTPRGEGALEAAFRQLCEKLRAEGLFDAEAKKPVPRFPRAIGVVTSPTGAALRDIRRTLARRWPAARVYLVGALVQGDQAAASVAEAVRLLDDNAARFGIDTIIVGRGGGSLEDLWAFNEEQVARAIFAARTPIISAVGHEVDMTVADMVADVRAATPTAGAELATPDAGEIARHVAHLAGRLQRRVSAGVARAGAALAGVLRSVVFRDPASRIRTQMRRVDELSHRLRAALVGELSRRQRELEPLAARLARLHPKQLAESASARLGKTARRLAWALGTRSKRAGEALAARAERLARRHPMHRLGLARQRVDAAQRQLEALSYRSVLQRGFSVTRGGEGRILRSVEGAQPGQVVQTELADGTFASRVEGPHGPAATAPPPDRAPQTPKRKKRPRKRPPGEDGPTLFEV
jgi:exodeoxyribonuclease VII large subunit